MVIPVIAFLKMGNAFFDASSAARLSDKTKSSTRFPSPADSNVFFALMASGGNGIKINEFLKKPSVLEADCAELFAPIVNASLRPCTISAVVNPPPVEVVGNSIGKLNCPQLLVYSISAENRNKLIYFFIFDKFLELTNYNLEVKRSIAPNIM
jgi:hypothetical protein